MTPGVLPTASLGAWLAVAGGGALGSVLRFACGLWLPRLGLPFATVAVNVAGSMLLGWLAAVLPARAASPAVAAGLTAGLCGGFTTMSTFALEAWQLWHGGAPGRAAAYAAAMLALCVLAAAAGWTLGRGGAP